MATDTFDIGDLVQLRATFVDGASAAADPTGVVVLVKPPSGNLSTYRWPTPGADEGGITRAAEGDFHVDVSIDESGYWSYRWESTGAVETAEESALYVRRSAFP